MAKPTIQTMAQRLRSFRRCVACRKYSGALQRFAQELAAISAGQMQVQIYANSQLLSDDDEMQALQLGAVDMLAPSLSKFGRLGFPEFELFDLPFLFQDAAQVHRVMQGRVG
ncbi:MAG: TRAP transporter substrate-binding protein DctP [Comamonas sp.]|nr:TRAP transporter substrate-binding protein DctP [Comamonas sp.]